MSGSSRSRSFIACSRGTQATPGMYPSGPVSSSASRTSMSRTPRPCRATYSTSCSGTPNGERSRFETQLTRNIRSP
ncbi:MAG: hypothetical protein AB1Z98_25670 [Nannocystaceae bacterium]